MTAVWSGMASIEITAGEIGVAAVLRKVLRHFYNQSAVVVKDYGLTNERYELLLAIRAAGIADRRTTIPELAIELELALSSITQLVRRAHDAGLIDRQVCAQDARVRYLALTAAGEELVTAAAARLGPERERLIRALQRTDPRRPHAVDDRQATAPE